MAKATKKKWTENLVFEELRKRFPSPAHALISQVRNGTGYARKQDRTADAIAVSCYPSRGLYIEGIEIKVSLSDWRRELASPDKSTEIQKYCKYWWVAAPKGVIPVGEVPDRWGLIEIDGRSVGTPKAAEPLDHQEPDMLFLCSILRGVAKAAEARESRTVPIEDVAAKVESMLEDRVRLEIASKARHAERLTKMVQQFEEASGVKISDYGGARIGKAVDFVLKHDIQQMKEGLERIRQDAARMQLRAERAIEELPSE